MSDDESIQKSQAQFSNIQKVKLNTIFSSCDKKLTNIFTNICCITIKSRRKYNNKNYVSILTFERLCVSGVKFYARL